ncbi:hypothetical protein [Adhaeribacter rhizoryzae]|uniref:hypothetical protein n=1 Tax=Adhaeribacter rhizoryzae TaxID=2607907 RepID=UPI00167FE259|nr:hypothetical protein [Adhaeribacter rhizoryzae]
MTKTNKIKSTKYPNQDYSIHDPNKSEISRQQQAKRFEKLKTLFTALQSGNK